MLVNEAVEVDIPDPPGVSDDNKSVEEDFQSECSDVPPDFESTKGCLTPLCSYGRGSSSTSSDLYPDNCRYFDCRKPGCYLAVCDACLQKGAHKNHRKFLKLKQRPKPKAVK